MKHFESNSAEDTYNIGKELGEKAEAGQVFALDGDLGTGKTVFTKGFAEGLGIKEPVNSPTFTILQIYEDGRLPLYHFDMKTGGFPCITSTYTELKSRRRWTKSASMTIYTETASA